MHLNDLFRRSAFAALLVAACGEASDPKDPGDTSTSMTGTTDGDSTTGSTTVTTTSDSTTESTTESTTVETTHDSDVTTTTEVTSGTDSSTSTGDTGPEQEESCALRFADQPAGVIVFYGFGNQIEGSNLQIFEDGSIVHSERTCCPPTVEDLPEAALSAEAMAALKGQISAVAATGQTVEDLGPMPAGEKTGVLCVVDDGQPITVKAYENETMNVILRQSTAPEAADIRSLVTAITEIDMPE